MEAWITALQIFREKGRPGEVCEQVKASAGAGLEGDRHADGGERQISILGEEIRQRIERSDRRGLCVKRFKENLRVTGLDPGSLTAGQKLQIGEAVLEITGIAKMCFPECPLVSEGEECELKGACAWAKVVGSGIISLQDLVIPVSE